MNSLKNLFETAEKISQFGKQFCGQHYSSGAKAWKFNPDCALAGVGASVCDANGSITEDEMPEGEAALHLDIEFFRHDKTPANADAAESAVLDFVETLGFTATKDGTGSGQFGTVNCYLLASK